MRKKGTFSDVHLSVAKRYLLPPTRRRMVYLGSLLALVFACLGLAGVLLHQGNFMSPGPLSSNHATFESDCAACHTEFSSVKSEKCSACHDNIGEKPGAHSFEAHYLYGSNDLRRIPKSADEESCSSCHQEHVGRMGTIAEVADSRCVSCHPFGSFNEQHPQFAFAGNGTPDRANLRFAHVHHAKEVRKREALQDVEETCRYCHSPEPEGDRFRPINFEDHCSACHLAAGTATPWLNVGEKGDAESAGVETLESMQRRHGPGLQWTFFANRGEFAQRGDRVRKSPVHHEDAWIMENLSTLRRRLYPDSSLADLLRSSREVAQHEVKGLYLEAIQTLEDYSKGLQSRPEPEVRNDLAQIDRLLKLAKRRVNDRSRRLDATNFGLATGDLNPDLTIEQADGLKGIVAELTTPCTTCHLISHASFIHTQADQRVLRRAQFNHAAHVLQTKCLDCHNQIPIREGMSDSSNVDGSVDNAEVQNIPTMENCQSCHRKNVTSNRCVTCHLFHSK